MKKALFGAFLPYLVAIFFENKDITTKNVPYFIQIYLVSMIITYIASITLFGKNK